MLENLFLELVKSNKSNDGFQGISIFFFDFTSLFWSCFSTIAVVKFRIHQLHSVSVCPGIQSGGAVSFAKIPSGMKYS